MRKRAVRILSLVMALVLMQTSVSFANEKNTENMNTAVSEDTVIEPRSKYLASGISEVTNMGEGILAIYADFASYYPVQWACLTIDLERKKNASDEWKHVDTYTYEFFAEDEPDGRLTTGDVDLDVHGLKTDYYYRVTCEHKVQTPSGSYETKTSRTDGVLLTSYPVFRLLRGVQ